MKATVSRVSQYGFKVEGNEGWLNLSKFQKGLSLNGLQEGTEIEYETNSKGFVTALQIVGAGGGGGQVPTTVSQVKSSSGRGDNQLQMARSTAAYVAADLLREHHGDMSEKTSDFFSLAPRIASYILTGDSTVLTTQPQETK